MQTAIHWADDAVEDLVRLREFIEIHNPEAARTAVLALIKATEILKDNPHAGKPIESLIEQGDYRDLVVPFGAVGYVMRYRYMNSGTYILHIRHDKEKGFQKPIKDRR